MRTSLTLLLAALLAIGPSTAVLPAVDYYVSNSGNDATGDGSQGSPWRTLTFANSQAGIGDTIHLEAGLYNKLGGETFPLILKDGLTVEGPATGTAEIDVTGAQYHIGLGITGPSAATTLRGLTISGSNLDQLVVLAYSPQTLILENNLLQGGMDAISTFDGTAPELLSLRGNTIRGCSGDAIGWNNLSSIARSLQLTSNSISSAGGACLATDGPVRLTLLSNTLTTSGDGLIAAIDRSSSFSVALHDNQIDVGGEAATISAFGSSGTLSVTGNTIVAGDGLNFIFGNGSSSANSLTVDLALSGNRIEGATVGGNGLGVQALMSGGHSLKLDGSVRENVVSGCAGDGVVLLLSEAVGSQLDFNLELGSVGADTGRNSFLGNNTSGGGYYELRVFGSGSASISAEQNWWGTTDSVAISALIYDANDGPAGGFVSFDSPGNDPLALTTNTRLDPATGGAVTVAAGADSWFLPAVGNTLLSVELDGAPMSTVSVAADRRSLVFQAPAGTPGQASLVVTNPGGQTGSTVLQYDGPPVANDDSASTDEDVSVLVDLVANDTDPNGAADLVPSSLVVVSGPSSGTILNNTDGTVTYTPAADFHGADSFTYTVNDLTGLTSNEATVTVTVSPVNDPPVAVDDAGAVDEDDTVVLDLVANDTDIDGDLDPTTMTIVALPAHGQAANQGDGTISYTPDPGYHGTDSLRYTVADSGGLVSNEATVALTIAEVVGGGTGSGAPGASSSKGGGCFLATAAYGDYEAPQVQLLRQVRDDLLAGNPAGEFLIRGYYANSPHLADVVSQHAAARAATRLLLAPVLGLARLGIEVPWGIWIGAGAIVALLRRKS